LSDFLYTTYLVSQPALPTALWFLAASLVLDLFDISLPRGDAILVSGAVSAGALLILGPLPAAAIAIAAILLANLARGRAKTPRRLASTVLACLAGFGGGAAAVWLTARIPTALVAYGQLILIPAAYLLCELVASQVGAAVGSGRPLGRLLRGNLLGQAPLLVAQWSASLLLLLTYDHMGNWSLIPVVALLLLMRQSYSLLLEVRETYRTTVEVLVEAAESQDSRRAGHAERSAAIARSIGVQLGLTSTEVERISYAALLHDVDALAAAQAPADNEPGAQSDASGSSSLLEGVDFFADLLPVLRLCDGDVEAAESAAEEDRLAAMIVALASDSDAAEHPEVRQAHSGTAVDRVSAFVPAALKSRTVGAALALGHKIPAVG
jgi:hypothetical protein